MAGLSPWLIGAAALLLGLFGCLAAALRREPLSRLIALELAGVQATLALALLAAASGRSEMLDVALLLALLSFPGGLVFARFLERWL